MDHREMSEVIKFLVSKGFVAKQILADMQDTLGEDAPSIAMIKRCMMELKRPKSTDDNSKPAKQPRDMTSFETVDVIKNLVKDDDRVTVLDVAKYSGISFGSSHTVLSKLLEKVKVMGRWVPKCVSDDRRLSRLEFCKEFLAWCRFNDNVVYMTIVDEDWIYHFDRAEVLWKSVEVADKDGAENVEVESGDNTTEKTPNLVSILNSSAKNNLEPKLSECNGNKREAEVDDNSNPQPKKKLKVKSSLDPQTAIVFWDKDGVVLAESLGKKITLNSNNYEILLNRLKSALNEKRPGSIARGFLVLEDYRVPEENVICPQGLKRLAIPSYSPDLCPTDIFLFGKVKEFLRGQSDLELDRLLDTIVRYLSENPDVKLYKGVLRELEKRCTICLDLNGDYVEK